MKAIEAKRIADSHNTIEFLKKETELMVGEERSETNNNKYPCYGLFCQHLTTDQFTWLAQNGYKVQELDQCSFDPMTKYKITWS